MRMKCKCQAPSKWLEEPPESQHSYRVECSRCGKFAKWGNQAELDALVDAGAEGWVINWEERNRPKPDALAAFMDGEADMLS